MRAARSDSRQDRLEAAAQRFVEAFPLRQTLGPAEDRGERVVQLVRDAGDRLSERGHFFGLQQLVVDIARLVVQFLPLADVAHQRFDPDGVRPRVVAVSRFGARRQLHPDRFAVGAAQPQQVVVHRSVVGQAVEQRNPRLRIDEAIAIERPDVLFAGARLDSRKSA